MACISQSRLAEKEMSSEVGEFAKGLSSKRRQRSIEFSINPLKWGKASTRREAHSFRLPGAYETSGRPAWGGASQWAAETSIIDYWQRRRGGDPKALLL